ncbi:MAG: conjugal transfer protein TraX [Rickettsiales bacterium]|jgi:hypothetical protein|nr:conjugal transfer protein TraX [Rickettsiales bacterium]
MTLKLGEFFSRKLSGRGGVNVYDILKNIAFFIMLVDHFGFYLFQNIFFLRVIGRMSMPIFVILYGYSYKKSNPQILIFGVIAFLARLRFGYQVFPLNILYTMYISGFALPPLKNYYDNMKRRGCFALFLAMFFTPLLAVSIVFEYGALILYLMFFGALLKKEKKDAGDYSTFFVIFLSLIFYASMDIGFVTSYMVIIFTCFFCLFYFLIKKHSSLRNPVYVKSKSLDLCLLFFSRFSLYLYPIHILLLILIKKCLF